MNNLATVNNNNNNTLVFIGLIINFIIIIMTWNLYSTSNKIEGKILGFLDTLKNIFGILPNIFVNTVDNLASTVDSANNDLESIIENKNQEVKNIGNKIENNIENMTRKKEVFNIDANIFTYEDAPLVCKAIGARLATNDEVNKSYHNGAHWCNYGWTDNQMALYPIQKNIYNNMTAEEKNNCGKPGLNGGFFDKDLKFGVNCFGYKNSPDPSKIVYQEDLPKEVDKELQDSPQKKEIVDKYKLLRESGKIQIRPFNSNKWSRYSFKNSIYKINPDYLDESDYEITGNISEEEKNPNNYNVKNENNMNNQKANVTASTHENIDINSILKIAQQSAPQIIKFITSNINTDNQTKNTTTTNNNKKSNQSDMTSNQSDMTSNQSDMTSNQSNMTSNQSDMTTNLPNMIPAESDMTPDMIPDESDMIFSESMMI